MADALQNLSFTDLNFTSHCDISAVFWGAWDEFFFGQGRAFPCSQLADVLNEAAPDIFKNVTLGALVD